MDDFSLLWFSVGVFAGTVWTCGVVMVAIYDGKHGTKFVWWRRVEGEI